MTRDDRGSAIVEFALVMPMLLMVAMAVVQLLLTAHVRAVLISAAAEGARAAALAGADPHAGEERVRGLVDGTLAGSVIVDVHARRAVVSGLAVEVVQVRARLPLAGLVAPVTMTVEGHALSESL